MGAGQGGVAPSGIEKMPTGIEGFDEITGGGLPRNRTTLVVGGSGTGKTVFALQVLVNGAHLWGEPGIFVALEERSRQVIANAASFGWDLPGLERDKLFFLDARMSPDTVRSGGFDLLGLLEGVKAKATAMGARRVVFDSIDVLLRLMHDPLAEQDEIYRLHDWLGESGLTGIITSGTTGSDPLAAQQYGLMQFVSDCVVLLDHRLEGWVSHRSARVVKYRGSGFAENEVPIVIGQAGVEVATFAAPETGYPAPVERVSSGVERFDAMLEGGYLRGSSTLITGAPGTAKSSLAGAFVAAACRRGERALFVGYDEGASEIVRNLRSVNIDLAPYIESGLLHLRWVRSDSRSPEAHLILLKHFVREHRPTCMVIDPLSALAKTGGASAVMNVVQRLLYHTKAEGITLLCTSLLATPDAEAETSEMAISTIADTWIHLTYVVLAGERNRALTIVKSRGTGHSNQVRELILNSAGIDLADPYMSGGAVLMGTLRWEREQADKAAQAQAAVATGFKQRQLEARLAQLQAQRAALDAELRAQLAELDAFAGQRGAEADQAAADQSELVRRRGGDALEENGMESMAGQRGQGGPSHRPDAGEA